MRIPRIFIAHPLAAGQRIALPKKVHRHLHQVLRLRAGHRVVLFDGSGRDFPGTLVVIEGDQLGVALEPPGEPEPPPPLVVHLGLGIARGERMEYSLQKSVELGVSQITLLFTERTMVRLSGKRLHHRMARWREILIAACEQSGRSVLPVLHPCQSLRDWLRTPHPFPLMLDPRGEAPLSALGTPEGALTLLLGPEGGLSPEERHQAKQAQFTAVRLGPRILRAETAPLAALTLVQFLWGDLDI